jgi:lysophospholipase L1-like esterase
MQPAVPALKERYMPDGLHPNDEGQKLIASRLAGFLQTL